MRITGFEWDDDNVLHLAQGHGIEPEEAEEVLVSKPLFKRSKKGHYACLGPTQSGRFLVIIFERKESGIVRVITGWDMNEAERRYYKKRF